MQLGTTHNNENCLIGQSIVASNGFLSNLSGYEQTLSAETNEHWETMSLDVPTDAMSDVDWGDIGSNTRKSLLYNLPSKTLSKLFSLSGLCCPWLLRLRKLTRHRN